MATEREEYIQLSKKLETCFIKRDELKATKDKLNPVILLEEEQNEFDPRPKSEFVVDCSGLQLGEGEKLTKPVVIPLQGDYVPADYTGFDEMVEELENWCVSKDLPWDPEQNKGRGSFMRVSASLCVPSIPDIPCDSPQMKSFICFLGGGWWLDDIAEECARDFNHKEMATGVKAFIEVNDNIWKGVYKSSKDLPQILPQMDPLNVIHLKGYEFGKDSIPRLAELCFPFIYGNELVARAMSMMLKPNYGNKLTKEAYREIRFDDTGYEAMVEFGLLARGVPVKPEVRAHTLYKLIIRLGGIASGLANDILSLEYDHKRGHTSNYVRILMKTKGMSLEEAVDATLDVLEDSAIDVERACEELLKEFEEDEDMPAIVNTLRAHYNGNMIYYSTCGRYGEMKFSVRERKRD